MAQLVIKGHHTRGDEIITLLEMLGGKNNYNLKGDKKYAYYTIDRDGEIRGGIYIYSNDESENIVSFTLEIFEDKFPYKVGDKVTYDGDKANIVGMVWDNDINDVFYEIQTCDDVFKCPKELLQPYKEETITIDDFKANTKEWLIDKLESMSKDNALQAICNLYNELHKPKYPKTFIEVLDFWHPDRQLEDDYQSCYKKDLIETFQDLLYTRDAYWKIAGEEMGLGKSWRPVWDESEDLYTIHTFNGEIRLSGTSHRNAILAFPTEEIRDAFYENFKNLIEQCKELL